LAAWFMTASRQTPMKSMNMISTIGRRPVIAAPTAAPTKPISAIGVSMTRPGPKRSCRPRVTVKMPPPAPTSMPIRTTRSSAAMASAMPWLIAPE
jgi:hypothetical protein